MSGDIRFFCSPRLRQEVRRNRFNLPLNSAVFIFDGKHLWGAEPGKGFVIGSGGPALFGLRSLAPTRGFTPV